MGRVGPVVRITLGRLKVCLTLHIQKGRAGWRPQAWDEPKCEADLQSAQSVPNESRRWGRVGPVVRITLGRLKVCLTLHIQKGRAGSRPQACVRGKGGRGKGGKGSAS